MQGKTAGIIYANRKLKHLTQEQLAEIVGVSPVAVSKWERGISIPNVDVLCKLADCFETTIDDLLGREGKIICENCLYSEETLDRLATGDLLIKCCKVSREKGLYAMDEMVNKESADEFLCFAVGFFLDGLRKGIPQETIFQMLRNYAKNEKDVMKAHMVTEILNIIMSGENEEYVREWCASYLGKEYRNKLILGMETKLYSREEILASYKNKPLKCPSTDLLEDLEELSDEEVRWLLKMVDSQTLIIALSGASGVICKRFLENFSDRLLYYMDDDIMQCDKTEDEIIRAQKIILEIIGNRNIENNIGCLCNLKY